MSKHKHTFMSKACLVILAVFISGEAQAQISKPINSVLSPNATSISMYGEIPVSPYTGTPNIGIPLYAEKIKAFELPISLQYHASGIRPDQRAGWVGLGWTLNAGGVISRAVNDVPDEYHNPSYSDGANAGYLWNYANVAMQHGEADYITRDRLRAIAQSTGMLKDTSPDEFSFNFGKYSGKFYLIDQQHVRIQSEQPVSVKLNYDRASFFDIPFSKEGTRAIMSGYSKCLRGFTIITEDGTQYVFGEDINAIDFSIGFFEQIVDEWIATSWYLTKIILPSQHVITLNYERGDFINQMYIAVYHNLGTRTDTGGGLFSLQSECSSWSIASIDASYQGKLISPVYLKEIVSDNNIISFDRSLSNELDYPQKTYTDKYSLWSWNSQPYPFLPILNSHNLGFPQCLDNLKWYKLDKITVKEKQNNSILKTIAFSYNNNPNQRLMLNEINESDKGAHKFYYDNPAGLPPYLANQSDHWGFYNGTYATLNYSTYHNSRNAKATYLRHGSLNKIQYPTGGYTEFIFEPHSYRKQTKFKRWEGVDVLTSDQISGGLRIKQIRNRSTSAGLSLVKEYYYVTDYLQNGTAATISSGVLGGQSQYYFTDYVVYAFNDRNVRKSIGAFSSISVLPSCHNANGSHIGYTEVIEKNADNSFTRHRFTNFDNGYLDQPAYAVIQESRTPYEPYTSKEMERGLLIEKGNYDANKKLVKKTVISYQKDESSHRNVNMITAMYRNVCPATAVSYDEGVAYKAGTYTMLPDTVTETYYDSANGSAMQSTTTTYVYYKTDYEEFPIPTNLVSKIEVTNSNGHQTVTEFTYPYTHLIIRVNPTYVDPGYLDMRNQKSMQPVIWKTVTVDGDEQTQTSEAFYYTKTGNTYHLKTYWLHYGLAYFYVDDIYLYDDGNTGGLMDRYAKVDDYGNPIHVIHKETENTVYLWGYNGQYLIAEIKNATYDQVEAALGVSPESLSTVSVPDFALIKSMVNKTQLKDALITVFKYRPSVGLIERLDSSGLITTYEYDGFGRLSHVRDHTGKVIEKYEYNYAQ